RTGGRSSWSFPGAAYCWKGEISGPVANAIASYCYARVEAFDPSRRDQPTDPEAPFIERVPVLLRLDGTARARRGAGRADALRRRDRNRRKASHGGAHLYR